MAYGLGHGPSHFLPAVINREGAAVKFSRIAGVAGLAGVLSVLLVVVPAPGSATAVSIPPSSPPPLSSLPSTVVGASSNLTGMTKLDYQMTALYQLSKKPAFWTALAAQSAGTATPTQTALVTSTTASHKVPAMKTAPMLKVGGALGAVSNFSLGTFIGNGVMTFAGVDVNGLVCVQDGAEMLAMLSGADCSGFEIAESYTINADAVAGTTWGTACDTTGRCVTILAVLVTAYGTSSQWTTRNSYCVDVTAGAAMASGSNSAGFHRADQAPGAGSSGSFTLGTTSGSIGSSPAASWACPAGTDGVLHDGNTTIKPAVAPSAPSRWETWLLNHSGMTSAQLQECYTPPYTTCSRTSGVTVDTTADPDRTLRCVILGSNGTTYTASTLPYKESDGVLPNPVCADLPSGVVADTVTIYEDSPMGSVEMWSETTTPEWDAQHALAPECDDGTCLLDLRSTAGSCFQSPDSCADWFTDPNRDTEYSCHYGTHAVDLAECYVYAPTFTPDAARTGDYYADPTTGETVGAPAGTAPGTDAETFGGAVQDPAAGRECFPTGWAVLNPVEWVMKPVQCALQWAFVPRPTVVTQTLVDMQEPWAGTAPYQVMTAVQGWAFVAPAEGCDGITVSVWFLGPPFQIMQACPGDMLHSMANWSRFFGNVGFSVYGVIAVTRNLARIFDFPGIGGD